jgi:minor extracellular serine protease Vpr
MRGPSATDSHALPLAVLAVAITAVLLLVGGQSAGRATSSAAAVDAASWRGLVGSRPRVALGQRVIVVLKTPSLAQRVAAAGGHVSDTRERAWSSAVLASQRLLIARLAVNGVSIRPQYSYTRVLNGFSAAVDAAAIPLLERDSNVVGVYPVRAAYPAAVSADVLSSRDFAPEAGHRPDVGLSGVDGRGVTIALLDTGVDAANPYLRARLVPDGGIDIVGGDPKALAARNPSQPAELERHGTQMAGLLVGAGGPAGLSGVATGGSVLPIRVAGWQQDATGQWSIYSRSDQIIAGLERAVDPNDDGDAHDAARIALLALAEPYAAFADGPEARAVSGALALDTLVVVPAGNDGASGPGFGSISGPGGAPDALTVGAVDTRVETESVRVVARSGLRVLLDRTLPVAGAVAPNGGLQLATAAPRGSLAPAAAAPQLLDFFDRDGTSRVAGAAALVPGGISPGPAADRAALAGAAAVLLYGSHVPPGGLGLDSETSVPVLSLPVEAARAIRGVLRRREPVTVAIGAAKSAPNEDRGRVAAFSSTGLAFDGRVKPDLAAPGVALATGDPGTTAEGAGRFVTVNGSSAAAAVVAGAAALLVQARPGLSAPQLGSLLAGTAAPLASSPVSAQGAGMLDVGAAAAGEIAATPRTLALGRSTGAGWHARDHFTVANVSTRPVRVRFAVGQTSVGAAAVRFALEPRSIVLGRGRAATITIRAVTASAPAGAEPAEGAIVARVAGGGLIRVPWTIAFGPPSRSLIRSVQLAPRSFRPSDTSPALLLLQAGRLVGADGRQEVRPVSRLDVELFNAARDDLGLLARLRDVLPGSVTIGLTGRDPSGHRLPAGTYRLRLTAWPTDAGPPSRWAVSFTIRPG